MSTILHFCDDSTISSMLAYLIHELTQGAYQVETITTTHPEAAIAEYSTTKPIPIVVVEYPEVVARTIQQLRRHPQFLNAKVLIITGRPQLYQSLLSDTVAIGDKLDRVPMLSAFLSENDGA
jgi:hypothetical protein